ncbi:MAG TPA: ATP-binding protein [Xanthobacteraceae bacterium]|nr:ATP-binding protein [Xanthobacteraceae bacterium]
MLPPIISGCRDKFTSLIAGAFDADQLENSPRAPMYIVPRELRLEGGCALRIRARISPVQAVATLLAAAILIPLLVLGLTLESSYRKAHTDTDAELSRTAEIAREHASKVLDTYQLAVLVITQLLEGLTDEEIHNREPELHAQLKQLVQQLPQTQSAYVLDRNGYALLSATVVPVPRATPVAADREFFQALKNSPHRESHVSRMLFGRIDNKPFFAVSRPRPQVNGEFNGVVNVSAEPEHIAAFYRGLLAGGDDILGLVRSDGAFLARFPMVTGPTADGASFPLPEGIEQLPERGGFNATSRLDGVERRHQFRKLPGYDIYVVAGRAEEAILGIWYKSILRLLAWGVPATGSVVGLALLALWRTRQEEKAIVLAHQETAQRQRAELALRQAERMEAIGRLTGGIAHDFNNILSVFDSMFRLLSKRATPDQLELIGRGLEALKRGQRVTQSLLTFARRQPLKVESVDVNQRILDILDLLKYSVRNSEHAVKLSLNLSENLWPALADPNQLDLSLFNLASNARDAMPNGGILTIETENTNQGSGGVDDCFVAIRVTDTGVGIPREHLPHVFEPLFTTKPAGKGTGLGLSSVYGFASQCGGRVSIDSQVGRGTTVTILLPKSIPSMAGASDAVQSASAELPARAAEGQDEDHPRPVLH